MTTRLPFGSWPSPLTAADAAAGTLPLGGGRFVGAEAWWLEGRPAEGGRLTVVAAALDGDGGAPRELVPAPFNVRSRVHEYGGASWAPAAVGGRDQLVFAEFTDQRLYRLDPAAGGAPVPLTPGSGAEPALRFAEFGPGPRDGELLAVCEDLRGPEPRRYAVAVPLDGSAADDAAALRQVAPPSRFVAGPRVSPDRRRIAWIGWEHPNMPWDATRLFVAELGGDGAAGPVRTVAGGPGESVLQPEWLDADTLAYVSDRSGWWNPYAQPAAAGPGAARALAPREEEFAGPLWAIGTTWYAVLDGGRLLASHGTHGAALGILDPAAGTLADLDLPYTRAVPTDVAGGRALVLGTSPEDGEGLRLVDLSSGAARTLRRAVPEPPDPGVLPRPEAMEFPAPDGGRVYAHVYQPRLEGHAGPEGELPPFVAMVHGGPTSQAFAKLDLGVAYYTSRGIGVVDINYGGSTGYGRAYRERLKGRWGIVDVADTVAVMEGLVAAGLADPARLAIEGGSAGGWTVLSCLTRTDTFAAGISRYGVADLAALAADTHDFESRYLDGLVGPWPEAAATYAERAPLNHVDGLDCPVLLLQGDEDKVVPPNQSQAFADALAAKGIPHAYVLFAGEQHGFRRLENIVRARELSLAFYAKVFGFAADVPPIKLAAG